MVVAGKSRVVYLLNASALGGIGGEEASVGSGCDDDVDGGTAEVGTTVYLPCLSGIIAVRASASPPSLTVLWRSGTGGGPPIVADRLVWTIGQDGVLSALDPTTGAVREQARVGPPANHFPTPSIGDGLLLAPAEDQVVAFPAIDERAAFDPAEPDDHRARRTRPPPSPQAVGALGRRSRSSLRWSSAGQPSSCSVVGW